MDTVKAGEISEVILLDSSLTVHSGHSRSVIEEIATGLCDRGLQYRVFSAKSVEPEIVEAMSVVPHFSRTLYDAPHVYANATSIRSKSLFVVLSKLNLRAKILTAAPLEALFSRSRACAERLDWNELNACFANDLAALPECVWSPENLVIVMATCQNQIWGLIRFLRSRDARRLPPVICHLMFPPSYLPAGSTSCLGEKLYRQAFEHAKALQGTKLFFTTENWGMQELFREKFGVESSILPVPLRAEQSVLAKKIRKTACLGFYGTSRCDKGFHLLPQIATVCIERGYDVVFNVQIQHSGWDQTAVHAERALRNLPNVRLIEGALSKRQYSYMFSEADIILLPYNPVTFGMRGSGVFAEAITAGCPVVASKDTFAAKSIELGETHGEVFAPYNARACADAIARLIAKRSELEERARSKAKIFGCAHNGGAYVETALQVTGLSFG